MSEEQANKRIPTNERFLLIKEWGFGFWSDLHDIWGKLLLAEITNRHPIVFWGKGSFYAVEGIVNSFEQYFLPVSDYSIDDVASDKYTYYPSKWNSSNIFETDPNRSTWAHHDFHIYVNCDADVLVSDVHNYVCDPMPFLKKDHPAYGLTDDDVNRYIINKYIKLQPDIEVEINEFYHAHMEKGPILAVHIRGGMKINEISHWSEINAQYPQEINNYLKDNPSGHIFLLTDGEDILEQYKQMYGDILIYTDCKRTADDTEICLKVFPDQRRKGIEIIKDTYLASKCDYFIGNGHSNATNAVRRLKVWEKDKIKLLL